MEKKYKNNIRLLMDEKHISLRQLASVFNSDHGYIGSMVRGEINIPASRLMAFADFFDCSIDYLLCRSEMKMIADKVTPEDIKEHLRSPDMLSAVKKETISLIKMMSDEDVDNIKDICEEIVKRSNEMKEENKKYYAS